MRNLYGRCTHDHYITNISPGVHANPIYGIKMGLRYDGHKLMYILFARFSHTGLH